MSRAMTRKYVLRQFPDGLWILFALLMSKSKVPHQTRSVLTNLVKSYDKEICPSIISRWIVDTVGFAYEQKQSSTPNKICAHKLRALSSSFAWLNEVPLDAILRSGYWCSEDSFIRFYLRDTAGINEKLFSLGPIVASQKINSSA